MAMALVVAFSTLIWLNVILNKAILLEVQLKASLIVISYTYYFHSSI